METQIEIHIKHQETTNINNNAVINHHNVTNLGPTIKTLYL